MSENNYVSLCFRWTEPRSVSFLYNPSWSENARMLSFCVLSDRGLKYIKLSKLTVRRSFSWPCNYCLIWDWSKCGDMHIINRSLRLQINVPFHLVIGYILWLLKQTVTLIFWKAVRPKVFNMKRILSIRYVQCNEVGGMEFSKQCLWQK